MLCVILLVGEGHKASFKYSYRARQVEEVAECVSMSCVHIKLQGVKKIVENNFYHIQVG